MMFTASRNGLTAWTALSLRSASPGAEAAMDTGNVVKVGVVGLVPRPREVGQAFGIVPLQGGRDAAIDEIAKLLEALDCVRPRSEAPRAERQRTISEAIDE